MSGFPVYDERQPPFNLQDFVQTIKCLKHINTEERKDILHRIIYSPTPFYTMLSTLCYYNCQTERLGSNLFDETDLKLLKKTNLFKKFTNFDILTSIIMPDDSDFDEPIAHSKRQTEELYPLKDNKIEIQKHLPFNVSFEEFIIACFRLNKIKYNSKLFEPEIIPKSGAKRLYSVICNPMTNGVITRQRTERYIKLTYPLGRPDQSARDKMAKSVLNDYWKLFQGDTKPRFTKNKKLTQQQLQERQIEDKINNLEISIIRCTKFLRELITISYYKPYYYISLNNYIETNSFLGRCGFLLLKVLGEMRTDERNHKAIQKVQKLIIYMIHERFSHLHFLLLIEMQKYKNVLAIKGALLPDKANISPKSVPKPIIYTNIGCPDHIIVENLSFVSQFMIFRQECIPRSSLLKFNKILSVLRLDNYSSQLSVQDARLFLLIISLTEVFDYFHPSENDRTNAAFINFTRFIDHFTEVIIPSDDFCKLQVNMSDIKDLVKITNGMPMRIMYDIIYFSQYLILSLIHLNQQEVSQEETVFFEKDGQRIVMNDLTTQEAFVCQFDPKNAVFIDEES
ncbi:hypothetical protein TVAG_343440 [Trichomonas vaginalis G3]|uniref:Uncharacterized protein n=1 Tax=Trichomonas vaginalis (strain ATCC PRA-98 / G3) TaxID=412133 RepID=A2E1E8_TRIV3|nr:hypothetical protein TVAGG3_0320020 [Trichomonas vaginalis G3]EAY13515.1 hypothetical protein TVAG_343440 [Trichomonas vaginalis G3]KAI5529220.1 hypothetical protein TVAGG3_0320020 [Trichomonas vaginalis G3]|eukprot:XP_001325738.1 hypothetical protein [Trichomonas vaginalis G3]